MKHSKAWSATVVREHLTWHAAPGVRPTFSPTPTWAMRDPARLVALAGDVWLSGDGGAGVVLWQPLGGLPTDRDRWTTALLASAAEYGWTSTPAGAKYGWFTFTRKDKTGAAVMLGVGPWIAQHRTSLFRLDDAADRVAGLLARYEEITGGVWRGQAGLSGCATIRAMHEGKTRGGEPLWRWDKAPREAVGCSYELRGSQHHRPMTDDERAMAAVYEYDTRAGYLAAAGVAEVGWSAPQHMGPHLFDPRAGGSYWTVRRDQLPADVGGLPMRLLVREGRSPLVTTTTPVLTYLAEHGVAPEIMDAWVPVRSGRHLRAWAERQRAGLAAGGETRDAWKDTYARTVGMLGRRGGRIFRPDWRDEVIDRARVNLVRKVAAAGVVPLRWNVDAVWLASDEPPEILGERLGAYDATAGRWRPEVGKLRPKRTMTPAEYEERYKRRG